MIGLVPQNGWPHSPVDGHVGAHRTQLTLLLLRSAVALALALVLALALALALALLRHPIRALQDGYEDWQWALYCVGVCLLVFGIKIASGR